ncbi:MAG: zinc transporter ZntB [Candidatus Nitronauta litoralis]|uniref:Zinc transporter ZntB n=1 Tax=Candidatus Nitronauta litoralis TaxID=2705533 RepID=A0A7T0FZ96_9BACT|nr:MAG: zinc transporter ZntB [Candidatus Nitronauta litoralis]
MDGLIHSYFIDENGKGSPTDLDQFSKDILDRGFKWVHLDYSNPISRDWILNKSGLDEVMAEALLAEATRPRCLVNKKGILLILRGISPNEDDEPQDMVSLRLWLEPDKIISVRKYKLGVMEDISKTIEMGRGPVDTCDFIYSMLDFLIEPISEAVLDIDEKLDNFENQIITTQNFDFRMALSEIRKRIIELRRYLGPQKEALFRLGMESAFWGKEADRARIREMTDRLTRYVEDLDSMGKRATIIHEELAGQLTEQINNRVYIFSIIAAIFIPLSFLTGLLGINVDGIPGSKNDQAFWIVCFLLIVICLGQIIFLKVKKWF